MRHPRVTPLLLFLLCLFSRDAAAQSLHLRAVGDILLAGPMGKLMARKGRAYPFAKMRRLLQGADIISGNLECCMSTL